MIPRKSITVKEGGVRLDAALLSYIPTTTRAFVREAAERGAILVNGRPAVKGLKLRGGETVEVVELLEASDNLVKPNPSIHPRIVFEDDAILGCDKPAGLPVQPLSCTETETLMNGVAARYPECIPLGDRPLMAGALHRIDADTSGLVLVARTKEAFEAVRTQFSSQTVKKTYLALVEGSVATGATLENDLVHDPTAPFCRMVDIHDRRITSRLGPRATKPHGDSPPTPHGDSPLRPLHAVTRFVPIGHTTVENEERTLLEVTIFTGVTHQIRAQLAMAGMHIVNDRLYGAFAVENQTGHCLHSLAAAFKHPLTGDPVEIRTPYPPWARL